MSSSSIEGRLARLSTYFREIDLSLRTDFWDLLADLGNPHLHLPPCLHVAGTNGKGSTVAFLRAMAEAAGFSVHVYTSPHLVRFNERIRLNGSLISEEALVSLLDEVEGKLRERKLTQFEIITIIAFLAFSCAKADLAILETGMGGRLDATNAISAPLATIITRISYDHQVFLGENLAAIAGEKAGIFKKSVPAIVGPQKEAVVKDVFIKAAAEKDCPLFLHGRDWDYAPTKNGFTLDFQGKKTSLPTPNLLGAHQYANAATAATALLAQKLFSISDAAIGQGLTHADWPARLQRLTTGPLLARLPANWEIWLDGGHNDSAGEVLATQAEKWGNEDGRPLFMVAAMLNTKTPEDFFHPLAPYVEKLFAIPVPGESKSHGAEVLAASALKAGMKEVEACAGMLEAANRLAKLAQKPARLLIAGSLYLAGAILREHG
jgi:dihydrofolate synthase/folylpolyglutamate synthase